MNIQPHYNTKYPTKLDYTAMDKTEWIKKRTIELYDYLPQTTLEDRAKYTDIRDEVINLNYSFFGYIAKSTHVQNTSVTYEDKFQSALFHFCEIWQKYRFKAKYRMDLAFSVFFKPRLMEEIKRELNEVKYSTERILKLEVAKQLNKHWAKVEYADLSNVDLPQNKLMSLKAIFGCMYWMDVDECALFIESNQTPDISKLDTIYSDNYDSVVDLLVHEMVAMECRLTDKHLNKLSEIHGIDLEELQKNRSEAEMKLYNYLHQSLDISESFEN